jgi:N-acetylglutamate synthase/N-acetylornithine aminotransferase
MRIQSNRCCAEELNPSGYTVLPESAAINPTSVSVSFHPPATSANPAPIRLLTNGEPEANIDEERASEILKEEDLEVVVDLGAGSEEALVWTCDFSHVSAACRYGVLTLTRRNTSRSTEA